MKRKLFFILSVVAVLIFAVCSLVACDEATVPTTPSTGGNTEETKIVTVEIINGEERSIKRYETGTVISLQSKISASEVFVCWLIEGEPYAYTESLKYTVEKDALIKAVYCSYQNAKFDLDGGEFVGDTQILVKAFGEKLMDFDGALLIGYDYILPVPQKNRYEFVGWKVNEKMVTDVNGVSNEEYSADLQKYEFVAVYEEKPYVIITVINGETNEEQSTEKHYIEDGSVIITAEEIVDRQCVGIYYEEEIVTKDNNDYYILDLEKLKVGQTYTFTTKYREAYKLTVISGNGGGSYTREEKIEITGIVPAGSDFSCWMIKKGGDYVKLGVVIVDNQELLCLIDGYEVTYYDKNSLSTVCVDTNSVECKDLSIDAVITLQQIENLGITISGGANTLIKAENIRKEHTLYYVIDCMVNGDYCLDSYGETLLMEAGFSYQSNGIWTKEEYYNYNDGITLASVPSIEHYKFGNWENDDNSGEIPSHMPNGNFYVKGTFVPEKYRVSVSCDTVQGKVGIGSGNTLSGYYEYGKTIEINVTANAGYELEQWLDQESVDASDRISVKSKLVDEQIQYVYTYKVAKVENFTVKFDERAYSITYTFTVKYDGQDVTDDESFFESGSYYQGYNTYEVSRKYGVKDGVDDIVSIKSETNVDGVPLIYGAQNWTVSEWVCDTIGLGNLSSFIMPKHDIIMRSVVEIVSYDVSFSKQDNVSSYLVDEINGKDPTEYVQNGAYNVPFDSTINLTVVLDTGSRLDALRANNVVVGEESGYLVTDTANQYIKQLEFSLINSTRTTYAIYGVKNTHTVTYYVRADYEHTDEDRLLSNYITYDTNDVKTAGGIDYYKVTGVFDGTAMQSVTKTDMTYGMSIEDPTINASSQRYGFSGWKKMQNSTAYNYSTMPDDSLWVYGTLSLNKYTVEVDTEIFKFDGNALGVNSANVNKVVEDNATTNYDENSPYVSTSHLYFSEITLSRHNPTGYDFNLWKVVSEGSNDGTVTIDVEGKAVGVVYKETSTNGKVFKYMLNDDDTITLYLTENSKISASFSIKQFTATAMDSDTKIKATTETSINKYNSVYTFDYGSSLDVFVNSVNLSKEGNKIVSFSVATNEDMTDEIENIATNYNEDELKYPSGSDYITYTTESSITSNVYIKANVEKINYKVIYNIYAPSNSISNIASSSAIATYVDYMVLNETKTLLNEDETKTKAQELENMSVDNTMYSGWYQLSDLSGAEEGKGLQASGGSYSSTRTYTHINAGSHVTFSCYLINIITATNGMAGLNNVIKRTDEYKKLLSNNHKEITIPGVINNVTIIEIASSGFSYTNDESKVVGISGIEKIIMPSTVTVIGEKAFFGCEDLIDAGLTDYVTTIGSMAYKGCKSLERVYLGESITSLGTEGFANASSLSEVVYNVKSTLVSVSEQVFSNAGASATDGITLTVGIQTARIPSELFNSHVGTNYATGYEYNGMYLKTVKFNEGDGQKSVVIGGSAFAGTGITTFNSSLRVTEISSRAFGYCNYLTELDLRNTSVTEISASAFEYSKLVTVILPDAVTTIGNYAFFGCSALQSVYYGANGISSVGTRTFSAGEGTGYNTIALERLTSVSEMDKENGGEKVIRLENLTILGEEAFYGCNKLTEVYVSGTNTVLGKSAFYGASSLKKVTYDVESGGDKTGEGMATFTQTGSTECELVFGENVSVIPAYMFYGFTAVKNLVIPNTITKIKDGAFGAIEWLESIEFNVDGDAYNVDYTPSYPIFNGSGSKSTNGLTITFGESVNVIKDSAFSGADVTAINIEQNENADLIIGENAFAYTKIENAYIPHRKSITVGKDAFSGATLGGFTVDESNEQITFNQGALSTSIAKTTMTISVFGRTMDKLWVGMTTGTLVLTKTDSGIKGVVNGDMATETGSDFTVGIDDVLILEENSTFTITDKATIHGALTATSDQINKGSAMNYFKGVIYSESDFGDKNGLGEYTYLKIANDVTLTEETTVSTTTFEVASNVELTKNTTLNTSNVVINDGAKLAISSTFSLAGSLEGKITALYGSDIVINNQRYFNGGTVSDNLGYGMTVMNDSVITLNAEAIGDTNGYVYTVTSGGLELNYDYTQPSNVRISVEDNGKLVVSSVVKLNNYESTANSILEVMESGIARLEDYTTHENKSALWTVVSSAKKDDSGDNTRITYYGTLPKALEEIKQSETVTMQADYDGGDNDVNYSEGSSTLDFNGFTLNLATGTFKVSSSGSTINATNVVKTGKGAAVVVVGDVTFNGSQITALGDAINHSQGRLTLGENLTITSSDGNAVTATGSIKSNAILIGKTAGIYADGSGNDTPIDVQILKGSVTSDGTGVYANNVTLKVNAVVEGDIGIKVIGNANGQVTVTLSSDATVTGARQGVLLDGVLTATVNATITADVTRTIEDGIYTGALVVVESTSNVAFTNVTVDTQSKITNSLGDAILYVGYANSNVTDTAVTVNTASTITGKVTELIKAYKTFEENVNGEYKRGYVYDSTLGVFSLVNTKDTSSDLYSNVAYENRRIAYSANILSNESVTYGKELINDVTVAYVTAYDNIDKAVNNAKGEIVTYSDYELTVSVASGVLITAENGTLTIGEGVTTIDGQIATVSAGKVEFVGATTINGQLFALALSSRGITINGTVTQSAGSTIYSNGIITVASGGTFTTSGAINLASKDYDASQFGSIENNGTATLNGSIWIDQSAINEIVNKGALTIGADFTTAISDGGELIVRISGGSATVKVQGSGLQNTTVELNRTQTSPISIENVSSLIVDKLAIIGITDSGSGTYTYVFDMAVTANEFEQTGHYVYVTFKNTFITSSYNTGAEYYESSVTLDGENNEVYGIVSIGSALTINGATQMENADTTGAMLYNTLVYNANVSHVSSRCHIVVLDGGLVVVGKEGVTVTGVYHIGSGSGFENNGGTLKGFTYTVSSDTTEEEITVNSQIIIYEGGWLITSTATESYVYAKGSPSASYEEMTDDYAKITATQTVDTTTIYIYTNCANHVVTTVAPTCKDEGYDICTCTATLNTYTYGTITLTHDKTNITDKLTTHTYVSDGNYVYDETTSTYTCGHVCSVCGTTGSDTHEPTYSISTYTVGDSTVDVLYETCSGCEEKTAKPAIFNATTVEEINTVLANQTFSITVTGTFTSSEVKATITGITHEYDENTTPGGNKNIKSVEIDGNTYYLWEITYTYESGGNSLFATTETKTAYVLIGTNGVTVTP